MYTKEKTLPRILSVFLAAAMLLTMMVSAFAADIKPNNIDATKVIGNISNSSQSYYAKVSGPSGSTQTKLEMTLYEKNLFGYKKVDSASASANQDTCNKVVPYTFKDGKSYKLTVTGSAYVNGKWDTVTKDFTASF